MKSFNQQNALTGLMCGYTVTEHKGFNGDSYKDRYTKLHRITKKNLSKVDDSSYIGFSKKFRSFIKTKKFDRPAIDKVGNHFLYGPFTFFPFDGNKMVVNLKDITFYRRLVIGPDVLLLDLAEPYEFTPSELIGLGVEFEKENPAVSKEILQRLALDERARDK